MKRLLFIAFISVQIFSSCKKEEEKAVQIRIENKSVYQFNDVFVNTSDGENYFGTVNPGENSTYKAFNSAYRYAYVRLTINNREYVVQPIDYVGESKLTFGRHTYILQVRDINSPFLNISYRKD